MVVITFYILSIRADLHPRVIIKRLPHQEELLSIIGNYEGLVVRSGVTVDEDLIAAAKRMRIIGRAGTGTELTRTHNVVPSSIAPGTL